ncbi:MAG: hypothetical protein EB157_06685 [Euryarchaeota archaeon]|nr:hypothetical protein [Euryarchaeota archaeon]
MTASQDDSNSMKDNSSGGTSGTIGFSPGGDSSSASQDDSDATSGDDESESGGFGTPDSSSGDGSSGGDGFAPLPPVDDIGTSPSADGEPSSDASSGWGLTPSDAADSSGSVADDSTATASEEHFAKLFLEVPADGGTYTGIGPIQGWALDDRGALGSQIDFYIDGVYQGQIAHGDTRLDVGRAYPSVPNANLAGFSSAFTFSALSPGWHEIEIITAASNGKALRASARFRVVRFDAGSYLVGEDAPRFTERCVNWNDGIVCTVKAGDITQTVTLKWSSATQSFEIVDIE